VAYLLVGCFDPQPNTGVSCADKTAEARCPVGLECVSRDGRETCEVPGPTTDAPRFDGPQSVDDSDGDGVDDERDNCKQLANPDQSDEDDDKLGDVCDLCPISADGADSDGDGVGDACDPNDMNAERIALFVSFESGLPAGWTAENAVAAGGDAILSAGANAGAYLTVPAPNAGFLAIWAEARFEAFVGTNVAGMGVMDRREPGGDKAVVCQLVGNSAGTTQSVRLYDSSVPVTLGEADHALAAGTTSLLRLTRETSGMHRCAASAPSTTVTGTSTFMPPVQELGLRLRSGVARYHWIMVLTRP